MKNLDVVRKVLLKKIAAENPAQPVQDQFDTVGRVTHGLATAGGVMGGALAGDYAAQLGLTKLVDKYPKLMDPYVVAAKYRQFTGHKPGVASLEDAFKRQSGRNRVSLSMIKPFNRTMNAGKGLDFKRLQKALGQRAGIGGRIITGGVLGARALGGTIGGIALGSLLHALTKPKARQAIANTIDA